MGTGHCTGTTSDQAAVTVPTQWFHRVETSKCKSQYGLTTFFPPRQLLPRYTHKASWPQASVPPKVAQLVGKKCLLRCNMNGLAASVLLDSTAQVSILDHAWKGKYIPGQNVRLLTELMGANGRLDVVNGDTVP